MPVNALLTVPENWPWVGLCFGTCQIFLPKNCVNTPWWLAQLQTETSASEAGPNSPPSATLSAGDWLLGDKDVRAGTVGVEGVFAIPLPHLTTMARAVNKLPTSTSIYKKSTGANGRRRCAVVLINVLSPLFFKKYYFALDGFGKTFYTFA